MGATLLGIRANLEVREVPRSVAFFERTLGLRPVVTMGEPVTFAILAADDASLALAATAEPAVAAIAACYVDVSDVTAAYERCRDAGAEITAEVTTHPWGMRDFVLRDPDGHQIAVGQRVER
ncbi:MAG TPA: VOC family protein [Acidimicrobiia bacterium]|nr:VOC family protein [Acidimicrobiia bacterium]